MQEAASMCKTTEWGSCGFLRTAWRKKQGEKNTINLEEKKVTEEQVPKQQANVILTEQGS